MANPLITTSLIVLTLLAAAASVLAARRLRSPESGTRVQTTLIAICGGGSAALFALRWLGPGGRWQPLAAHVDGLLLIAALFAGLILFIQWRPRLFGLSAFATPLLALILAWGICASAWTYHPFELQTLHPVWKAVHLTGVYLGTLGAAVAAIAGGMYLYVQWRLKRKVHLDTPSPLASLETLERLIIRAATLGFGLLTVGLVSGLVILTEDGIDRAWGEFYLWKVGLAAAAWLTYAVVMNVRYATSFRGARAAWLSIAGLVLLIATYGVVTALPAERRADGEAAGFVRLGAAWAPGDAFTAPRLTTAGGLR